MDAHPDRRGAGCGSDDRGGLLRRVRRAGAALAQAPLWRRWAAGPVLLVAGVALWSAGACRQPALCQILPDPTWCELFADPQGRPVPTDDTDGDGIADAFDNCPLLFNADQADADGDGVGDVCDNCPDTSNADQIDSDGDLIGDACDLCPGEDDRTDCDADGVPDCAAVRDDPALDCNANGIPDICDLAEGRAGDANDNGIIDECEEPVADCNGNGVEDAEDLTAGTSSDCNANGVPDECDIAGGASSDCNANNVPDECEIEAGTSDDCDADGVPDECQADRDGDGLIDACDGCPDDPEKADPGICGCGQPDEDTDGDGVADCEDLCPEDSAKTDPGLCGCGFDDPPEGPPPADGTSDCNENGRPDICEIINGEAEDCDANGVPDECDLAGDPSRDCNTNGRLDVCDIAEGTSEDCNSNGVPDECDIVTAGGAGTSLLFDNGGHDGFDALPSQRRMDAPDAQAADDFTVPFGAWQVEEVRVVARHFIGQALTEADVQILEAGAPGQPPEETRQVYSGTDLPVGSVLPLYESGPYVFDLVTVPLPGITLPAARYLLIVSGVGSGDGKSSEQHYWATANVHAVNSDPGWFRCEGLAGGFGCPPDWTSTTDVLDAEADFAFSLWGVATSGDCNGNGVPDECDIADGTSEDENANGIPDECECALGDLDCDGDVDIADFNTFAGCFSGSGGGVPPGCEGADFDGDGDVDISDFATFSDQFTGSQ